MSPNLPIVTPKDPFCEPVLPPPCYGAEDSIDAAVNVLDCQFAVKSARLLALLYSSGAAAEAAAVGIMGAGTVTASGGLQSPLYPEWCIARQGGVTVFWVSGTKTFQQLAIQVLYAGFGPVNMGFYSTNPLYDQAAVNLVQVVTGTFIIPGQRLVLVGHSYGGACCSIMAAKIRIGNPAQKVQLLTFGQPKPGDERLQDILEPLAQMHYADFGDPVPFLPPAGVNYALFLPLIGPILAAFWPIFVRPRKIKVIQLDGTITDYDPNAQPDTAISTAVAAIAAGIEPPAFRDHYITYYAYYLCLGCTCVPRPCTVPELPLNFMMQLRNFSYRFDGVIVFNSVGVGPHGEDTLAEILEHFDNGYPSKWKIENPVTHFSLVLVADPMVAGAYTTFRCSLNPFPLDPVWLQYWDFTSAELNTGHFVNRPPTHFEKKLPTDAWFGSFDLDLVKTPF